MNEKMQRTGCPWYCPHSLTFVALLGVAVPTVLANLSRGEIIGSEEIEFGWPKVWYWKMTMSSSSPGEFRFSAAHLAMNMVVWIAAGLPIVVARETFLRHVQVRFRWSLRTMMAVIAIIAVGCAWYSSARNRASMQDPLIAELEESGAVQLERWGPQWFDLLGIDHLRRRIVGVRFDVFDQSPRDLLNRACLPGLRWLDFRHAELTPAVAESLAGMKELRMLVLRGRDIDDQVLEHVARLKGLEILDLSNSVVTDDGLTHLAGLRNLEALYLADTTVRGRGLKSLAPLEKLRVLDLSRLNQNFGSAILENLPPLPRLEFLDLSATVGRGESLRPLAKLPLLRTLKISGVYPTGERLDDISKIESLEELVVDVSVHEWGFALEAVRHPKPRIVVDSTGDARFRLWRGQSFDDEWPFANRDGWPWESETVRSRHAFFSGGAGPF
jgi:hypothetical protein